MNTTGHRLISAFLLLLALCLAVAPAMAATWSPPTDTSIYGVEWNASDPSPNLTRIDVDGNPISDPDFNSHVIWGNIKKVLLDDNNVVTRDINPRGDNLDLTGASGKVMTEIPKFYVRSENASTGSFRYYRWWVSPEPADGFTLHPAFVQRGGTERDYIYIGSYEATLRVLDNGSLALDSRTGEQPWTGYYNNPLDGMFKLAFDAGTSAPSIGATVTGNTSGTSGTIVDYYLASGSWSTGDAAGTLYLKQTTGSFTNDEPLKISGTQFAVANTPSGNAGIVATINNFEGWGEALGPGYGAMNVWSLSAIKMLYLVEHATWASQETTGLGIVSKSSGTGFNGEITGYGSVDTNVNEYGTGTGTGTAGYTPASYRTMTDLWGNSWEWVTGYTSTNTQYQITKRDGTGSLSTHPLAAGSYETSSVAPLGASGYTYGYWTSLEYEDLLQYQFIPNSVTGGSSTTYGTDYFYSHNPGTRVLLAGGAWRDGRDAGLGFLYSNYAASVSGRFVGARLEFVGPSTLAGDAPGANYTQNVTVGNAPLVVAFNDTSTGSPGWWLWDFGDGNRSTEQHPVYTYVAPGNYTVTMTAYTLYGSSTINKTSIEVLEAPVANFTTNTTEGNAPLTVLFTDTSTGDITAWNWSFGDGNSSTDQHPVYTYTSPGIYSVTLNVSNAYGYSHSNKTIEVLEPPTANFTANTTEGNAPLTVQFNDTSTGDITAWNWSFGDGNSSTDQHPIYTYVSPGIYQVTLNVSNAYSSSISPETTITVLSPPAASFTANTTEGNAPLTVQFTDTSTGDITVWNWTFGDGNSSTDHNPVYTYVSPGTYQVTLNVSNAYGYSHSNKTIEVFEPPIASFTTNTTGGNAPLTVQFNDTSTGDITAWNWSFGDGNSSTDQHPIHTYVSPGTYQVTLNVSNAYSSSISPETTVTVLSPPAASFTANTTEGNAPLTVQFTDTSTGDITVWNWTFGDGNSSTDQHPVYTYVSPGTYLATLNVSNAHGYSLSNKTIEVFEPPIASFTANTTEGNAPLTIQFNDTSTGDITAWNWSFGDGNSSTDQNPVYTYTSPGIYQVTLNVSNAYSSNISPETTVTVLSPPAASFTTNTTEGNAPLTVQFTDTSTGDITAWNWSFGDGNSSTDQHPIYTYTSPGTYLATLNVSNAYGYSLSNKTIVVFEPPIASFTVNTTEGNAPLTVQFNDTSTGDITAWNWSFGDGNSSTDQHPIYTYVTPGIYQVILNVSNAYSSNISPETTVTVLSPPAASFTTNTTEGNAPLTVQFNDTSTGNITAWNWTFGDGNSSTDQHPIHTYVTPGTYSAILNVSNAYGYSLSNKTIDVLEPPTANFTTNITQGLIPLAVQFTDTSTGNVTAWNWTFGDGNSSTDRNPTHTYVAAGIYTVSLTASNAYSNDTLTRTDLIAAYSPLVANFTTNITQGLIPLTVQFNDTSTGSPTSWFWTFGDGNSSTDQNPVHTYTEVGYYTVSLTVSHPADEKNITRTNAILADYEFTASFTQNTTYGMVPLPVQFTDTTDTSVCTPSGYYWTFGDGNSSTDQNPVHTYTQPGYYNVSLTVYGILSQNTKTKVSAVHVGILPTAAFTANLTSGYAPLTVQFTSNCQNTNTYHWDFGDGSWSTVQNPTHTYNTHGTYTVTLTATNIYGSATATDNITVNEVPPVANFTADPLTGEVPVLIRFTDTSTGNVLTRSWDFGDGNTSTLRNPTHLYNEAGTYTVTLTVSNTGGSNTLTKQNYITLTAPEPSTATPRFPETDRVKTLEATDLGTSSVTLHGSLDADTAREVWFEYGTKSNSYGFTVARQQAEPGEVFSATVSSFPLVAGQTYYYRAACADGYGRERSFTLPVIPPGPLPTYGAAASQFIDSYKNESTMIEDIATATWSPYTDILGSLFFAMVIGAVFLNLAMKGRSLALPAMLVLVIGLSLWTLLPPEAAMIAQAFIILAIGGIIYWISTKRKI